MSMFLPLGPTKIGHVHESATGVYIGRSKQGPWGWGNPFIIGDPHPISKGAMNREDVIREFELWIATSTDDRAAWMRENVHKLRGQLLKCWCRRTGQSKPACHGDVLKKLAEANHVR